VSRLLIPSEPLVILPQLAKAIGLNEAIFLQQLHYWLEKSKHEHDGRRWVYNTYNEWQAQFPFWSLKTLQRIAGTLVKRKLLIVHKFNDSNWDKTNWYSIDYEALSALDVDTDRLTSSRGTDCLDRGGQSVAIINKVSETTTETTPETRARAKGSYKPKPKPEPCSIHCDLMALMKERTGKIPNPVKEAAALDWLIENYTPEQIRRCFNFYLGETWRTSATTWEMVKSQIGQWLSRQDSSRPPVRVQTLREKMGIN
jgi:hypothetical protein